MATITAIVINYYWYTLYSISHYKVLLHTSIVKVKKSSKSMAVKFRIMRIITVDFGNNNEHNDTIFEEIWNKIIIKIWSIIPWGLEDSFSLFQDTSIKLSKKSFFKLFVFTHTKNCYNSCMHTSIWLKFGTLIESLKLHIIIKVKENVIRYFMHITKSNICHE